MSKRLKIAHYSVARTRDYSAEDREGRITRRKARWCPTTLIGWPAVDAG